MLNIRLVVKFGIAGVILGACQGGNVESESDAPNYASLQLDEKPNMLWLVTEDMGPYIQPFGDSTVITPNLSRMASEGVIYHIVHSPSGVCAPSRFAIAKGMYPSGSDASHMGTNTYTAQTGMMA